MSTVHAAPVLAGASTLQEAPGANVGPHGSLPFAAKPGEIPRLSAHLGRIDARIGRRQASRERRITAIGMDVSRAEIARQI